MTDFSSIALLSDIRERASVGSKDIRFNDQALINRSNRIMREYIVPIILGAKEDYLLKYFDTQLSSSVYTVDLPEDCIGMRVRDAQLWNLNNGSNPFEWSQLTRLTLSQLNQNYQGFYVENNTLKIYPQQNNNFSSYTLRVFYYGRPLEIVLPYQTVVGVTTYNALQITNIVGLVVSFTTSIPADFVVNARVNGVSQNNPFRTLLSTATITAATTNTITLSSVTGLAIGDWVCYHGESIFPQIPYEIQGLLAQAVAAKILEVNNMPQYAQAAGKLEELKALALSMLVDRTESTPAKITNANGIAGWIE